MGKYHIIVLIILSLFIISGFQWKNNTNSATKIYTEKEQIDINAEPDNDPIYLIYTADEQKKLASWKNKTMDDLIEDAFNCDSAASYDAPAKQVA